jgi:hypothetical protein
MKPAAVLVAVGMLRFPAALILCLQVKEHAIDSAERETKHITS